MIPQHQCLSYVSIVKVMSLFPREHISLFFFFYKSIPSPLLNKHDRLLNVSPGLIVFNRFFPPPLFNQIIHLRKQCAMIGKKKTEMINFTRLSFVQKNGHPLIFLTVTSYKGICLVKKVRVVQVWRDDVDIYPLNGQMMMMVDWKTPLLNPDLDQYEG